MAGKKSKKKKKQDDDPNSKHVCTNRKARHEYDIVDELECGIALLGSEVKSIRNAKISAHFTPLYIASRRTRVRVASSNGCVRNSNFNCSFCHSIETR